jgi:hypothetical protein
MDAAIKELYERGLKVRREVLGDKNVDNAIDSADEFTQPLQEYLTAPAAMESFRLAKEVFKEAGI